MKRGREEFDITEEVEEARKKNSKKELLEYIFYD